MHIRDIFWNTFETLGSIDAYMAYKETQNLEHEDEDMVGTESKAWCG